MVLLDEVAVDAADSGAGYVIDVSYAGRYENVVDASVALNVGLFECAGYYAELGAVGYVALGVVVWSVGPDDVDSVDVVADPQGVEHEGAESVVEAYSVVHVVVQYAGLESEAP